ncbi:MAG TPA: tetratricopeptide repeat protein [Candidatus Ozemobacteraceae bacterium]|nr:tetratricopeptide repeat protein [Candidatus Ozemobacteraceae bacterium]
MRHYLLMVLVVAGLFCVWCDSAGAQVEAPAVPTIEWKATSEGWKQAVIGDGSEPTVIEGTLSPRQDGLFYRSGEEKPYTGWMYSSNPNHPPETLTVIWHYLNGTRHGWEFRFNKSNDGKQGSIHSICEYKNGKPDGVVLRYHENGKLASQEGNLDGRQHGPAKSWFENGQLWQERAYKNGERDGLEKCWFQNGKQNSEQSYTDGKLNGPSTMWYENGNMRETGEYTLVDKNGEKRSEKHGLWKEFREEDGTLSAEKVYDKGEMNRDTWYNKSGVKTKETMYAPGRHALIVTFDEASGFPASLYMQKDHTSHGTSIRWYVDKKQISAVENHFEGKLHGPFEYFGFKGERTRNGYHRDNTESATPVERTRVPELEDLLRQYLRMGTPKGANWPELQTSAPKAEPPATVTPEPVAPLQTPPSPPDDQRKQVAVATETPPSPVATTPQASESSSLTSMFDAVVSGIAGPAGDGLLRSAHVEPPATVEPSPGARVNAVPDRPAAAGAPVVPEVKSPARDAGGSAAALVTCPSCGKKVEAGAFCDECGSSLTSEKSCVKCGKTLAAKSKFCKSCGAPQSPTKEPARPTTSTSAPVAPTEPVSIEKLLQRARESEKNEKFAELLNRAHELLQRDPGNAEGLYLRGIALRKTGKPEKAVADLQRVTELQPGNALAHYQLGHAWRAQKNLQKAIVSFEKTARLDPRHWQSRYNLFDCLSEMKRFNESLVYLQEAEEIEPHNELIQHSLGFNLVQLERLREALEKFLPLAKNTKDFPAIQKNIGACYYGLNEPKKALPYFQAHLRMNPEDQWIKERIAEISGGASGSGNSVKGDLSSYINHPTLQRVDLKMQEIYKDLQAMGSQNNAQVKVYLDRITPFLREAKKSMSQLQPSTNEVRRAHALYIESIGDLADGAKQVSQAIRKDSRALFDSGLAVIKRASEKRAKMLELFRTLGQQ